MSKWFPSPAELLWETIGTAVLFYPVKSVVVDGSLNLSITGQAPDSLASILIIGITLAILIFITGLVDLTCHFNPAVTLALALWDRLFKRDPDTGERLKDSTSLKQALARMVCQTIGAIIAAGVLLAKDGPPALLKAKLGASQPAKHVLWFQPTVSEGVGMLLFLLVLVVVTQSVIMGNHTARHRITGNFITAIFGGLGLSLGFTVAGSISGGAINPAIWFGPLPYIHQYKGVEAYLIGPFLASVVVLPIVATLLHRESAVIKQDAQNDELNWRQLV